MSTAPLVAQLIFNQSAAMDFHNAVVVRRLPNCGAFKKKNVGILLLAPTVQGLRIALCRMIEQRENPR